jgi:N,N'-diacetyllegionaminate synthase
MIIAIRNIELAMGGEIKDLTDSERPNIVIARKSIVAKTKIKKGEVFSSENLTTKRPGSGISPMKWDSIIGKVAKRDYSLDDLL